MMIRKRLTKRGKEYKLLDEWGKKWYTTLEAFRTFLREETIYPGSTAASGITWAINQTMKVRALQCG
ncbi:MAG: hypothetical protein WAK43_10365, partial [Dehalococcoidales bacterium]